jgi:pimeloyl-ACP methyl ester carboxylesterase
VGLAEAPARTVEESVERHLAMLAHIGSSAFPPDEKLERAWATAVWDRCDGPRAGAPVARQIGAIQASGDRTADLARITAPTLVVHGDRDLMVHPTGGRATAARSPARGTSRSPAWATTSRRGSSTGSSSSPPTSPAP